jgi:hypothetical protein
MQTKPIFFAAIVVFSCLIFLHCKKKEDIIIVIDDVIMLSRPAVGLEGQACTNFDKSRVSTLATNDSLVVQWSEGKALPGDTIKIIRLEMLRDTGALVQFTMTLRPLDGVASEIQCMKGFGCGGNSWEHFPWIVPNKNFLDNTTHQFTVIPRGVDRFTIRNYNPANNLIVRVNPAL